MSIFGKFKKNKTVVERINFNNNYMQLDGMKLKFPLSIDDVISVLGEPEVIHEEREISYIFHDVGMVFNTCDKECIYLKHRKAYIDEKHNIVNVSMYFGDKVESKWREKVLPNRVCKIDLSLNERPINIFFKHNERTGIGDFNLIYWSKQKGVYYKMGNKPNAPISISYDPPRPKSSEVRDYTIKKVNGEVLKFDNLNFKLSILQILIYDLELLKPYFDVYEFAKQYKGEKLNLDSMDPIEEVLDYFKELPIPKKLAKEITVIDMDGGDEIYANIAPQWDGEDEAFDVNDISDEELKQFPNLKKAICMTSNPSGINEILKRHNILYQD